MGTQQEHDATADAPRVSTVMATRGRPELVRTALDAIAAQRYDGVIETVLVFDQTEPDEGLASEDPHRPVRVVRNARTAGLAGARNTGILQAAGDLVAFCDDDDTWLPEKTARQVQALAADPDADVVVTGMVIDYAGREITRVWPHDRIRVGDLARSRVQDAHPSSFMVRREALVEDRIGLVDESLPGSYAEDHDWLLRAARIAPVLVIREPLVRVLWHRDSWFVDRWRTIVEAIDHLIAKHEEIRSDRQGMAYLRGRQAFAFAALGDRRRARQVAMESLRLNPVDRRAAVALLVSSGVVSPRRAMRLANAMGRGI